MNPSPFQPTGSSDAARRAAVIESVIPAVPSDIVPLRRAFSRMVTRQWEAHVPAALENESCGRVGGKARFLAEMYARACYSMLLVSADGPAALRLPVHATAKLPLSRGVAITLGSALLGGLDRFMPQSLHRQLMLMSTLMGLLDVLLDENAGSGEAAVLRIASLLTGEAPVTLSPDEGPIATLSQAIRRGEEAWQCRFWESVLQPAVRNYCLAEALAVHRVPDPTGLGHRWAGIEAAIKGMWYVVGSRMGLRDHATSFEPADWNREQRWMADTSLLMQMIDDWVDQDEDRGMRLTPVVEGDWSTQSVDDLCRKTSADLSIMLGESGIRSYVLQQLFVDLYHDYLRVALEAMRTGIAA